MNVSWLPDSYEAAMAITDDPDNSSMKTFRTMYDFLADINFVTSRAMWVYENEEPTGTPFLDIKFTAPLLTDKECLGYCKQLSSKGFEICLHGASSGNNHRARTIEALKYLTDNIGYSPVFICHSKNADNLYWDVKTANSQIEKYFLKMYTKNKCFGDVADSDYFWGDICMEKIRFIRMFRTRSLNTLAFNPSMPYHDFTKPYVNFWFSATKGHIPNLFSDENIDQLCREHGAGILYQYLHKYVKDGRVIPDVKNALEKIADDKRILKKPASYILERLKQMQNVLMIRNNGWVYVINASSKPLDSVQIQLDTIDTFCSPDNYLLNKSLKKVTFRSIEALSYVMFQTTDKNSSCCEKYTTDEKLAVIELPKANVYCNMSSSPVRIQNRNESMVVGVKRVFVKYRSPEAKRLEIIRGITQQEITRLKFGQMAILLREHLFLGRKLSTKGYLENPGKVEDIANW